MCPILLGLYCMLNATPEEASSFQLHDLKTRYSLKISISVFYLFLYFLVTNCKFALRAVLYFR